MNGDILIDWAIVSGAAVVIAFVVNQFASWAGYSPSPGVKSGVAFGASLLLAAYFSLQGDLGLPDYAVDPVEYLFALAAVSTLVYKAAQQIYDRIWSGLIDA